MLDGLVEIGARVHLASTRQFSDQPWTEDAVGALQARGLQRVWLHRRFRGQARLERWEARYRGSDEWHFCSWWLRRWFGSLIHRLHPSSIVIHYAMADRLLDHARFAGVRRIIEMHDLSSVNGQMNAGLDRRIKQFVKTGEPGDLFDVDLHWGERLEPDDKELAIYDQYDAVIAISRREQALLQKHLRHSRVEWIPMHIPAIACANVYDAPPVFFASGNKFNQAGLLLLLNEVLRRVLAECPDFQIDVVGDLAQLAIPSRNVRYPGYVPDLSDVCRNAAFAICPVFAGTGQQVKIIEAMAHGLAVVAFRRAAAASPLRHGENGFIAEDIDQFAMHLVDLWRNRGLCRQLGTAARATLDGRDSTASALRSLVPIGRGRAPARR
jgi:glycosyltransferase involved in cell wall biosynthesis